MVFDCEKVKETCKYGCCWLHFFPKDLWIEKKDKAIEVTTVSDFGTEILVLTETMRCPFFKEGTCLIYEDRPPICEKFGSKEMPCPWQDYRGRIRPKDEVQKILKKEREKNNKLKNETNEYFRKNKKNIYPN